MDAINNRFEKQNTQIRDGIEFKKRLETMAEERRKKADEKCARELAAEQRRKDAEDVRLRYSIVFFNFFYFKFQQRQKKLHVDSSRRNEKRTEADARRTKNADKFRSQMEQHDQKVRQRKVKEMEDSEELREKIQQKV
jgi:hypothetical protein